MDESPMFISDIKLYELYERLSLYIQSNYPLCLVSVNQKSVAFGYPNEYARIFVYQDKEKSSLIIKISQDITQPMGPNNGLLYKIKSIDDVQYIKSGIKVILECKVPKILITKESTSTPDPLPNPPAEKNSNKVFNNLFGKFSKN